jgi:triacylglycerol esterase/lipase EstA (alpha/beta hydrolase family)
MAAGVLALTVLAGCTPASPAAPDADPVVIVAGTGAPKEVYEPMANRLRGGGYEVHIFTIASPFSPFEKSSEKLVPFVEEVLAETGAEKVDIIGHSQGVILMRYAAKFLGLGDSIDTMVNLGGGIHGSDLAGGIQNMFGCLGIVICTQSAPGSDFVVALNTPYDTLPGIHHVNITSIHEQVATPYTTNFMTGPGDVHNILVQDQCPASQVEHALLATDGAVASGIDDALAHRPITLDCDAF